jgi:hypothetical protein
MPRKLLAIPTDESDTEGHVARYEFAPEDGDQWLDQLIGRDQQKAETAPVRIRLADDDETEGHIAGPPTLRLVLESEDDTEGHAISVQFPSVEDADRFRRRLLAAGVLVGAVAIGATSGAFIADRAQSGAADVGPGTVSAERVTGEYAADRGIGVAPEAAGERESLAGNPNRDVMPR